MAIEFFSVGQRAEGVIAIGQEATGIIAIGQIATGVFALGQFARGVVAIGQVSIGFFSVGMLSLGLSGAVGMIGAGARGIGGILPIVPGPLRRSKLPNLGNVDAIRRGRETGWAQIRVGKTSNGYALEHASGPIQASIAGSAREGAETAATRGAPLLGLFGPGPGGQPELRRLMWMGDQGMFQGSSRLWATIGQLVLLAIACAIYFQFVAIPIGDFVISTLRFLVTGQ
jgi:hypothetical protein